VVLAGLAGAGLTAVASNQRWLSAEPADPGVPYSEMVEGPQAPLAFTLSLVVLAAWGVLLVTRGRVRRVVAALAALAALGVVATVVAGWWLIRDDYRDDFRELGTTPLIDVQAWYWVAVVTAALTVVTTVLALRLVGSWPEMGSRYDAPGDIAPAAATDQDEERSSLDIWKAMDEGRDPTA
jgi:uncharacterized membrane protein (TIGR02234 family)